MEFEYSNFFGKCVFNPEDIILRFEHKSTARIYEQTFFDRDFVEYGSLGGLEFISKLLSLTFDTKQTKPKGITITSFEESSSKICLEISYSNDVFLKNLSLSFKIPAIRKQTGGSDMDTLQRKFTKELEQYKSIVDTLASQISPLTQKLKELEEKCGDCIVIPGVAFPIPVNSQSVIIVRDCTSLPNGDSYALVNPKKKCRGMLNQQPINWQLPFSCQSQGITITWEVSGNSFIHTGVPSISNLKYLTKCQYLTLSGTAEITDYSAVGFLTELTHLSIVASHVYTQSTNKYTVSQYHPNLSDISWIRNLKKLTSVSFNGCHRLTDITPLKDLPNLRELDITGSAVRNTAFLTSSTLKITQ